MEITLNVVEKSKGYLVVEFNNKYYRICNFTYENNKNWDLMQLIPDTFTMDYDNIKIMNKKIYENGSFDALHLGTYKTKKEGLKSLFNYILRNYNN